MSMPNFSYNCTKHSFPEGIQHYDNCYTAISKIICADTTAKIYPVIYTRYIYIPCVYMCKYYNIYMCKYYYLILIQFQKAYKHKCTVHYHLFLNWWPTNNLQTFLTVKSLYLYKCITVSYTLISHIAHNWNHALTSHQVPTEKTLTLPLSSENHNISILGYSLVQFFVRLSQSL